MTPPTDRYRGGGAERWTVAGVAVAAFALVLFLAAPHLPTQERGSADPSLAKRIEELQRHAGEGGPAAEVLARLQTLWEWANLLAERGITLPIDAPLLVYNHSLALKKAREGEDPGQAAVPAAAAFIGRLTRELAAKQRNPEVVGRLELRAPDQPRAGESVTFEQIYMVGPRKMQPGGGLVLFRNRAGRVQNDDPAGDNFVSVRSSRPGVRLSPSPPWGEWHSFMIRSTIAWRLEGAPLEPGDTITLTYGDTSGGGRGLGLQSHSNDQVIFPVLVDLDGGGEPWTPVWPSFEVHGRPEVAFVNLVAPSVVEIGEPFEVAVRSEDRFKNPASGAALAYTLVLDGEEVRRLAAGGPALQVISGLRIDDSGVHRFEVVSADGSLRATSNPIVAREDPSSRVFWGDLHGHCGLADGQGTPDGYYRFGRDVARLDFLSLSEHDALMDVTEWRALKAAVAAYNEPGRFTPLLGYEWTQYNPVGGHHNVYFPDRAGREVVPVYDTRSPADLYRMLRAANEGDDVLVVPHAHESADWRVSDSAVERLAEIQSGHGTFEYFGNRYLQQGWQIGFVGASDNHGGHPGYSGVTNLQLGGLAAVTASENTARQLFDALRQRRVYATTGERILLDARLNGGEMGRSLPHAVERHLTCEVHGTAPLERIDVVKNGSVVYTRHLLDGGLDGTALVQLTFESSSEVFTGPRNPRGERAWRATVDVEGARLGDVELPWFSDPTRFRVTRPGEGLNRLELTVGTRGRGKALLLTLEEASPETTLEVAWAAGREPPLRFGATPDMIDRPPAELPADSFCVLLGVLVNGPARKEMTVGLNIDAVQLQLVPSDAPLDAEFEFRETDTSPGDYYYLRVTQVDGAMAWSSPWWIGGE
jgi:hypothetical protein